MPALSKIGIIQNAPLTADLSNNLRQIVQGYRECLDHGAQLVIASSYALCGCELQALAKRRSFLLQTHAALHALAAELGSAPLLLAAYTPLFDQEEINQQAYPKIRDNYDLYCNDDSERESLIPALVPFCLSHHSVTELPEGEASRINGWNIYIDCDDISILPDIRQLDLMVRLPVNNWYSGAEGKIQLLVCGRLLA